MKNNHLILCFICLLLTGNAWAGANTPDTTRVPTPGDTLQQQDALHRQKFLRRFVNYFAKSDKGKPRDQFDITFIGGPNYNTTTGLGIAVCGAGVYFLDPQDSALQQSNITIAAQATTKGMFSATVTSDNFLPHDRFRSHARFNLTTFRNKFWGIGYADNDLDANKSMFTRNEVNFRGNFVAHVAHNFFLGPTLYYTLFFADKRDSLCNHLLGDLRRKEQALSVGVNLIYDSRDIVSDPQRGIHLNFEQRVSPQFLNSGDTYLTTDLILSGYQRAWKGCVITGDLHAQANIGNDIPWSQFVQMGNNYRMRGYYEGRYRDRNIIEAQIEFRQHLWKRIGMVWWVGAANVFRDTKTWRLNHTLPNYGIGFRWRFKPGVNIRMDYGFTRNGGGLVFQLAEAF